MKEYDRIIAAYSDAATELVPHCEALPAAVQYEELRPLLPANVLALDIGVGSELDAAWLGEVGFEAVAVEPAAKKRVAASTRHRKAGLRWFDDRLHLSSRSIGSACLTT